MTRDEWTSGKPCQVHELAYCADCRDAAGMRRAANGDIVFRNDCAVATFVELTGASYDEGVTYLRAAGYHPTKGTPAATGLCQALEAAGYTVRAVAYDPSYALALTAGTGRAFFVSGQKGKYGHAWSISEGVARRALTGRYRYRIFEVTA